VEISLTARSAIITGGIKGIGLGIATYFAQSGADVAIIARGREALESAARSIDAAGPGRIVAVAADVSLASDVERAYEEVMREFGKIDIVVNNAGTSRAGPLEELTDDLMQQDLDQKLFSAIRLTRLVWPQMKQRHWGRVLNVLSVSAKAPGGRTAPTAITRAAGMALTKILAGEGAAHNILVNALLIGIIESAQHAQRAERLGISFADHMERLSKHTPLGRAGKPQDVAHLACLLASDAGGYITGAAINVDGGRSPVV
jgi:NAD(P)-dependent dehydrogenase (short-subunit alcohol dehydrogenase family)